MGDIPLSYNGTVRVNDKSTALQRSKRTSMHLRGGHALTCRGAVPTGAEQRDTAPPKRPARSDGGPGAAASGAGAHPLGVTKVALLGSLWVL